MGVVEKRGSFYTVGEAKIGQGRENAKQYLKDNPDLCEEIELAIRQRAASMMTFGMRSGPMQAEAAM
jgi:recombination protein RecA